MTHKDLEKLAREWLEPASCAFPIDMREKWIEIQVPSLVALLTSISAPSLTMLHPQTGTSISVNGLMKQAHDAGKAEGRQEERERQAQARLNPIYIYLKGAP